MARAVVRDGQGRYATTEFRATDFLHCLRVPDDHAARGVAGDGRATFLCPCRGHHGRGVAGQHAVAGAALLVVAADVGPQNIFFLPAAHLTCGVDGADHDRAAATRIDRKRHGRFVYRVGALRHGADFDGTHGLGQLALDPGFDEVTASVTEDDLRPAEVLGDLLFREDANRGRVAVLGFDAPSSLPDAASRMRTPSSVVAYTFFCSAEKATVACDPRALDFQCQRASSPTKTSAMISPPVSPVSSVFPSAENATDTGNVPGYSTV